MTFYKKKNSKFYKKGFTILELLVVIAIIGILTTIVIVSLNTARINGRIGGIKVEAKDIFNTLSARQIDGVPLGTYSNDCPESMRDAQNTIFESKQFLETLWSAQKKGTGHAFCVSNSATNTWGVAIDIPKDVDSWCFDSTGKFTQHQGNWAVGYYLAIDETTGLCN